MFLFCFLTKFDEVWATPAPQRPHTRVRCFLVSWRGLSALSTSMRRGDGQYQAREACPDKKKGSKIKGNSSSGAQPASQSKVHKASRSDCVGRGGAAGLFVPCRSQHPGAAGSKPAAQAGPGALASGLPCLGARRRMRACSPVLGPRSN
jgi:hypothetical protein